MRALAEAERRLLANVWHIMESKFVPISNGNYNLRTIGLNTESKSTPLVMVHGMGSGVGLWALNLSNLSKNRPVYAFDVLGFGRSSRPKFSKDAMLVEIELVESIEDWRKEMGLKNFIILGHSMGGYVAAAYALRYPSRVRHLVLADPWGFPEKPADGMRQYPIPTWIKVIAKLIEPFNPLAILRATGPLGPRLVNRFRPDLIQKFSSLCEDDTSVSDYIYHCNAQTPSGETAFKNLTTSFGWAKNPMVKRIGDIPKQIPITLVYGSRSWIDSNIGYQIKYLRHNSYVDVQIIRGAGHHVYADTASMFNLLVNRIGTMVDKEEDRFPHHSTPRNRVSRSRHTSLNLSSLDNTANSSNPSFASSLKTIKSSPMIASPGQGTDAASNEEQESDKGINFSVGEEGTLDSQKDEDMPSLDFTSHDKDTRDRYNISGPITPPSTCSSTSANLTTEPSSAST